MPLTHILARATPAALCQAIRDFYGLKEDFPRDQLLLRNGSSKV